MERRRKFWGWGFEDQQPPREEVAAAAAGAREHLGFPPAEVEWPVELDDVELRPPRIEPPASLAHICTSDRYERVTRSYGKAYRDLVRARRGWFDNPPDVVARPADEADVERVIAWCEEAGAAAIPFGGGTSVVGGVEPPADRPAVSIDLSGLDRVIEVDRVSRAARIQAGVFGPALEDQLREHRYTLRHFPQSFEYSTLGGWIATRAGGHFATLYTHIDDLVESVRAITPRGVWESRRVPGSGAGPSPDRMLIGSEGTLGVITEVTCRVRPAPDHRHYEGWIAADFEQGRVIVRELAQRDEAPDVLRLSDEEETRVSLELAGTEGFQKRALETYLSLRRRRGGCLMICGWEGERGSVRRRRTLARKRLRRRGAVPLGASAGRSWERSRYTGPYLRDELMNLGALVETLETAHTWSRLDELYRAVGAALRTALGPNAIVMCHVSHAYADGASLYFTFIARARRGEELEQWREAKSAACEAIVSTEGTITHHHAVGRDHAPYMTAEVGKPGLDTLAAVKERLDPAGIMNPGKLLPG
jgi:alkyldihydroxyacetonephosphate synthase